MSDKQDDVKAEDAGPTFDVMPGSDKIEADPAPIDLSFDTVEEEAKVEEVEESAEAETVEEVEDETEEETTEEVSEEDGEETVAEAAEEEPVEEVAEVKEEPKAKKPMVPKSRLDEVLAKQKALQKQLEEMKAANEKSEEAPADYDFDAKEVEYQNMVLDGESEKAVALRREIRKAEREQLEYEMRQEMNQTVQQNQQVTALQQAASAMEETYPVFDQNSDQFSQEMTDEVVELRDAFIYKGYDPVDALSKSVNYVVKANQLEGAVKEGKSLSSAPSVDEVSAKRKQVKKKIAVAESQPPELAGESSANRGEKETDLMSLSDDEFDALPEATLKRLRGDIL